MSKRKTKQETKQPTPPPSERLLYWDQFFRQQRSPILRSQLLTSIMAGKPLEVDRLPTASLLDVLVLAQATRTYCEAEIVDDFNALCRRANTMWQDPMYTHRIADQTHLTAASFIAMRGGETRFECAEDRYIPAFAQWLLEHDPPQYFTQELEAA